MRPPPFLVGAALLFWGWQTGQYAVGLLAALFLEGGRHGQWRWDLNEKDYQRLWDLSTVLYLFSAVYFYTSEAITVSAYLFFIWLPITLLPIMTAQWMGPLEKIRYRTFAWLIRRRKEPDPPDWEIDISYPYFALVLVGVSATNTKQIWFFAGLVVLVGLALWAIRPRRLPVWIWAGFLAVVVAAAYEMQMGLQALQNFAEGRFSTWIFSWLRREGDTSTSQTAIGSVGRLKLSGRILWRLRGDGRLPEISLLRQASFTRYKQPAWHAGKRDFAAASPETNDVWLLTLQTNAIRWSEIGGYLKGGKGVLPLPLGTVRIEKLPSATMEYSPLGVVRVDEGPGFVQFKPVYRSKSAIDSPPDDDDLEVPEAELPAVREVAGELALTNQPLPVVLNRLQHFFSTRFRYASYLDIPAIARNDQASALARFLLKNRSGHCEYFATATVLLLRQAGCHARYAIGYSVQESTSRGNYLVRERHGHAWCLVYRPDKNTWEDFDTTPASWLGTEEQNARWHEAVADFFSRLWFEFNRWRYGKSNLRPVIFWLLIPLAVVLGGGVLLRQRRALRPGQAGGQPGHAAPPGFDSEFYAVERRLAESGWPRVPHETLGAWLRRIPPPVSPPPAVLETILGLHYRYRFDPLGLDAEGRRQLREKVSEWLQAQTPRPETTHERR